MPGCFLDSLIEFNQSFRQTRELEESFESGVPRRNVLPFAIEGFFLPLHYRDRDFEQDKNLVMPEASEAKEEPPASKWEGEREGSRASANCLSGHLQYSIFPMHLLLTL